MTFLNAALLFGAFAASVPLIIHLLHRTKTRVINWAAMQFLAGAVQRKSRRLQWQQWLLLALRCAIPALLALTMAQPALTWLGSRLSDNFTGQPLVLTDSSLATLAPVEEPIASGQQLANSPNVRAIVDHITDQISRPQILQNDATSSRWQASSASTSTAIANRFSNTKHPFVEDLTSVIDQFNNATDDLTRTTLVVATDMRRSLLSQATADQKQRIRSLLSSSPTAPQLVILPLQPLAESVQARANVGVHIDASSDAVVGPKQTGRIDFTIGNFGNDAANDVVIDVQLDGQTRGTFRTTLAAGQIERRSVWLPPLATGDHACEIIIDRKDAFVLDNRAAWVVQSIVPQKVLLISGTDRNSSADFMHFAIAPPELGTEGVATNETVLPRQFEVIGPFMQHDRGQIENTLTKDVHHVVLCNIGRLDDDILKKIMDATASGSLVVLAGKNLDVNWFNQAQAKYAQAIPFEFTAGARINKNGQALKFAQAANLPTGRQMIEAVAGSESAITLQQAWELKIKASEPQTTSDEKKDVQSATDILAVDSQDVPILALRRHDNQTVLVSACDFYPEDTSLPVTDAFLPLIQGFYQSFITAEYANRNLACGNALPAIQAADNSSDDKPTWRIGLDIPRSSEQTATPQQSTSANMPIAEAAMLPGFFTAKQADATPRLAASQMPWSDSDLTISDITAVRTFATDLGASLWTSNNGVTSPTSTDNADEKASAPVVHPRFIVWRYVLAILLVALFAELLLQRHLARSLTA